MRKIKLKPVENSKLYQRRALSRETLNESEDDENSDYSTIKNNNKLISNQPPSIEYYNNNINCDTLQHNFDKNNHELFYRSCSNAGGGGNNREPLYIELNDQKQKFYNNNSITNTLHSSSTHSNNHNLVGYVESQKIENKLHTAGRGNSNIGRENSAKLKMESNESRKNVLQIIAGCVNFN